MIMAQNEYCHPRRCTVSRVASGKPFAEHPNRRPGGPSRLGSTAGRMIISHQHRFIFFHNPKSAGMSLRPVLAPFHDDPIPLQGNFRHPPFDYELDFAHLRLWEIQALFPAVLANASIYRSLIFVRTPYQRFVSAIDQHFKTYCPNLPLPELPPEQQRLVIETFIGKALHPTTLRASHRFIHFSPQAWFLQSGALRLPVDIVPMDDHGRFIARGLQSLGLPPCPVPHNNRSRLDLTHVLSSPTIRAFVQDFYAEDFAFLAADPTLAHLAEPLPYASCMKQPAAVSGPPAATTTHDERATDASFLPSGLLALCCAPATPACAGTRPPTDANALLAAAEQIDAAAADLAAGRQHRAFDRVKTVLAAHPDYPRALGMLGQIALSTGHPAIGLAPLQRAVALDPRLDHIVWLALCLAKLDCPEDAVNVIAAGINTMPPTPNAHFAVGMVYYALGRYQDAARFYASCIALDAGRADARHRYARALQASGATASAVDAYLEAIRTGSSNADYYADLSGALSDLGRFEEACAAARTAAERDPGCVVAHNNLGHALLNLNRSADAARAYEKAIEACDAYAKAQFGYALALLKCGDFARGWRQYEWRWQDSQAPRTDLAAPLWAGQNLDGQTILLHAEQGLGDTLQFVRFAPLVAQRGARVVLQVPSPLVRLLRHVDGVAVVVSCDESVPRTDVHCPMASLPLVFDLRIETIPASPYLKVPPEACVSSRRCPAQSTEYADLVVGLVWAGDPRPSQQSLNRIDRRRSTSLEILAPLLDIDGIRFVSFQFGEARQQLADCRRPIIDAMEDVSDFADTACRLAGVDLLISVDTSMVHLAGGMGVPVWMLSRFDGCWRWLERRSDSPWYPSMRIFRQSAAGDWSGVVAEAAAALRQRLRTATAGSTNEDLVTTRDSPVPPGDRPPAVHVLDPAKPPDARCRRLR